MIVEELQEKGIRILCVDAFSYFLKNLKDYPGNYLEIGVFEGFSLRELAKTYPEKMFYGVDPFIEDGHTTGHNGVPKGERMEAQREATLRNIKGIRNILFFEQSSRIWGNNLTFEIAEALDISCVLIDGDHSYEECSNDIKIAIRCLNHGGVIWIDDQGLSGVAQAMEEVQHHERFIGKIGDMVFIK